MDNKTGTGEMIEHKEKKYALMTYKIRELIDSRADELTQTYESETDAQRDYHRGFHDALDYVLTLLEE